MSISTLMEKSRAALSDEDSRWWRTNVLCAATLALCIAMAVRRAYSDHSYVCILAPVMYTTAWNSLRKCRGLLDSLKESTESPVLVKVASEIHSAALSLNITIGLIAVFWAVRS